jgi:hypothetical protein
MVSSFSISIGGMITRLIFGDDNVEEFINKLAVRYQGFITSDQPGFGVKVLIAKEKSWLMCSENQLLIPKVSFKAERFTIKFPVGNGEINIDQNSGFLNTTMDLLVVHLEYYLRILYSLWSYHSGGLLIHAAGISHNELGYAFVGQSGFGKTTIVINSPDDIIFSDDLILVFPDKNKQFLMFSTPFSNSITSLRNQETELHKIFFLRKNKQVYLEKISYGEAVAEIFTNIPVITDNLDFYDGIIHRIKLCLTQIPYLRLHFLPDPTFWKMIDDQENEL